MNAIESAENNSYKEKINLSKFYLLITNTFNSFLKCFLSCIYKLKNKLSKNIGYKIVGQNKLNIKENNKDNNKSKTNSFKDLNIINYNFTFNNIKIKEKPLVHSTNPLYYNSYQKEISGILYPDNLFRRIWDIIIIFLLLYTAIILPYTVCFIDTVPTSGIGLIETIIDFMFLLDIFINFFSAYIDDVGIIIDNKKLISINYLSGYFFMDFVSSLPIQLMLYSFETDISGSKISISRIYKTLRLIRFIKMIRVKKYDKILNYLFSHFNLNVALSKIVFITLITFLLVHISSCLWFFITKLEKFNNSWIFENNLTEKSDFHIYITCFYWSTYTLFTIGFGNISPNSIEEKIFCIIWIVYGALFYSYTFGNLKTIINNFDKREIIINNKLKKVEAFSEKLDIGADLSSKIKSFFEHKYKNNLIYDNDNLLDKLSEPLVYKIIYKVFEEFITNYEFLNRSKGSTASNKFVIDFILSLKPLFIKDKNFILYEYGQITSEEVYFNIKGRVKFLSEENYEILVYSYFTYFGEVEVLFDENRFFTSIITEPSELLFIKKENYINILKKHARIFELEIYKAYKRREFYINRTKSIRESKAEYLKRKIYLKQYNINQNSNTSVNSNKINVDLDFSGAFDLKEKSNISNINDSSYESKISKSTYKHIKEEDNISSLELSPDSKLNINNKIDKINNCIISNNQVAKIDNNIDNLSYKIVYGNKTKRNVLEKALTKINHKKRAQDVVRYLNNKSQIFVDFEEMNDLRNNLYKLVRDIREKLIKVEVKLRDIFIKD